MKNHDKVAGQSAILLCAVLWSTSGLFIKLASWHPVIIAGSRSFLGVFFLLALRRNAEKPEKILRLAASGLLYASTMILFVIANKLTFSANAIVLQYTAPIWTCLLGWFYLKEKPYWEHWFSLGLVFIGMFLVFGGGIAAGFFLGDSLALISGITFAANSVMLRIIQIGAASALYVYGMKRVRAVQAMLTASIEPVLNPMWVLLITGEKPSLSVILGGLVIISAVVFSSLAGRKREMTNNAVNKSA
jgi:drug/metabolite transporter (DMT)-like permease